MIDISYNRWAQGVVCRWGNVIWGLVGHSWWFGLHHQVWGSLVSGVLFVVAGTCVWWVHLADLMVPSVRLFLCSIFLRAEGLSASIQMGTYSTRTGNGLVASLTSDPNLEVMTLALSGECNHSAVWDESTLYNTLPWVVFLVKMNCTSSIHYKQWENVKIPGMWPGSMWMLTCEQPTKIRSTWVRTLV